MIVCNLCRNSRTSNYFQQINENNPTSKHRTEKYKIPTNMFTKGRKLLFVLSRKQKEVIFHALSFLYKVLTKLYNQAIRRRLLDHKVQRISVHGPFLGDFTLVFTFSE